MEFDFFGMTNPGRVRDNNEDAIGCDPLRGLAVLADGMGGYNAGEIASAMAVTFIRTELSRWLQEASGHAGAHAIRQAMEVCVGNANLAIFNASHSNPQFSGMGTTLVLAHFSATRIMLGHVGDSRCYRLRAHQLEQLTKDHSLLQEQLEAGFITPEQAKVATNKNLVTRALGVEDSVVVDIAEYAPKVGDTYMFCSDGLSDMVNDREMQRILSLDLPLANKATALVQTANDAGGRDNISVILVQAKGKPMAQGFLSRMLRKS